MNADDRVYLDTSALAKWYLSEPGSEIFVEYLQGVPFFKVKGER